MIATVQKLHEILHHNDIEYCHWKSNEHLDAALSGDTDLDILFSWDQKDFVDSLLKSNGFKLYRLPWFRRYKYIEDYITIDYRARKIIHVHAHFKLMLGPSGIKNYHLGIENNIISNRIFNTEYNVYINKPEYEIILLLVRLGLKYNKSTNWNLKSPSAELNNFLREYIWLKDRIDYSIISNISNSIFPNKVADLFENCIKNELNNDFINKLDEEVNSYFRQLSKSVYFTNIYKLIRKTGFFVGRLLRFLNLKYIVKKRKSVNKGFMIALIGSDGSGKSTQISILSKLLSTKIDVLQFYMGSNKGSKSWHRKIISSLYDRYSNKRRIRLVESFLSFALIFSMGFEKRSKLRKAMMLREKGIFVICDRFPQIESPGRNDGPKLLRKYANSNNFILKAFSIYEKRLYKPKKQGYPDLIFKIIAEPTILAQRRDMSVSDAYEKQKQIKKLNFGNESIIIEIDGNKNIENVTSDIMQCIYESYFNRT